MKTFPNALALVAGIFAAAFMPPEPVKPSEWMAAEMVVPDGPRAGSKWDPSLAPYVAAVVDPLGPDGDANFVVVRKSAQTGLSAGATGLVGCYVDRAPCRIGYAVQTTEARKEFSEEKLSPTIAGSPALKAKVFAVSARSSRGSTTNTKRYPGGALSLIIGSSAADLKSRTLKVGVADEVDAWPADLGDDGDPLDLFKGRFTSFHATGDWRLFVLSTPTVLGSSRIDGLFKAGDQRFWHVECPACRSWIVLEFKHLKFNRRPPYAAHYVAQCCGHPIEHHEKATLVRGGKFIATNAEGTYPSFHVDALISQLTTWDECAKAWWDAQGDEKRLNTFFNNWLGLAFEIRGDAPDYVRLLERKGGYPEGRIPARGLITVVGADVQHTGIWYEVVAFAPNAESWTIRHDFIEGDTTDPERGAFAKFVEIYETKFPDAWDRLRSIDALAIDAGDGGRFNQVLAWARGRPHVYAIKGVSGWTAPAIGTPTTVDVTLAGRKLPGGAMLWPVGTWPLKSTWYANLRKLGKSAGQETDPPGYCHFHDGTDERYFRQMTSEYLGTSLVKGRSVRLWKETGPNHLLDCRVYAMAMAEYLGLSRLTDEQWSEIARNRGMPTEAIEGDLFAPDPIRLAAAAAKPVAPAPIAEDPAPAPQSDRTNDWWGRR